MYFLFVLNAFSQSESFKISGKIIDDESKNPIESVTVQINNYTVVTNTSGEFYFDKLSNGIYELKFSSVGYLSITKQISVLNKNIELIIELENQSKSLRDLEVKSIRASAKMPFAKTNLFKGDIEKLNTGQDIPFILNQTPSVVINSDAGTGIGYTGISIRGTDASRINVTLNGIPFNDAESQGTFFVDLPDFSSSTNSIQIQRGVGTSSNGTSAFGATINVSTNEINANAYAELNNSYGSFNSLKNTVKIGTGLMKNNILIDARLSQIKSDGYIDRANSKLQSFFFSTAYIKNNSSLRFNIISGKEKTYQAWNGISESKLYTNRTFNISGTEKTGEPYMNETDNYTQSHYQLFYNQKVNSFWHFNTAFFYTKGFGYYENYKANQKYSSYGLTNPNATRTDLIRQQWLDNDFYGQIISTQYKKGKSLLTMGGSWNKYLGKHIGKVIWAAKGAIPSDYQYYYNNAIKSEWSSYAKLQQSLSNQFDFFIDLQYRTVNYQINGFKKNPSLLMDRNFGFFNPKIGLTYSKNGWQTFLSYSIANKEPNRADFEVDVLHQPKSERLHDVEFGIEKRKENFNVSATIYYMNYNNQLVLTGKINDVGAYTRTNVDNSYRLGLELQAGVKIHKSIDINSNVTISKNKIKNFSEFIDNYDLGGQNEIKHSNTNIALSPSIISSTIVNLKLIKNIQLSLIGKFVGEQFLDNTQNSNRKLASFYTQDIKAIFTLKNKLFKETLMMLNVNNIFNKMYQPNGYTFSYIYGGINTTENYYFPMAGTNFNISLNLKL